MQETELNRDAEWLAAAIDDDPARVAAELELGQRRRAFVVGELIEAGFSGQSLLVVLMQLTGVAERQARALVEADERRRGADRDPVPRRDARLAQNEISFRQANERIAQRERHELAPEEIVLVCECSDSACVKSLTMPFSEYEWLRQNPLRFVVLPGHEAPAVEDVVGRHEGYVIVEKHAATHRQVEAADPRSRV